MTVPGPVEGPRRPKNAKPKKTLVAISLTTRGGLGPGVRSRPPDPSRSAFGPELRGGSSRSDEDAPRRKKKRKNQTPGGPSSPTVYCPHLADRPTRPLRPGPCGAPPAFRAPSSATEDDDDADASEDLGAFLPTTTMTKTTSTMTSSSSFRRRRRRLVATAGRDAGRRTGQDGGRGGQC